MIDPVPRDLLHSHSTLQFFAFDHLPPETHEVGRKFGELAEWIENTVQNNSQKWAALQKLLEAKDAGIRAVLFR